MRTAAPFPRPPEGGGGQGAGGEPAATSCVQEQRQPNLLTSFRILPFNTQPFFHLILILYRRFALLSILFYAIITINLCSFGALAFCSPNSLTILIIFSSDKYPPFTSSCKLSLISTTE